MTKKKRLIVAFLAMTAVIILLLSLTAGVLAAPKVLVVNEGTLTISESRSLNQLVIGEGANLVAPPGYTLTLTVNGVEMGQALAKLSPLLPPGPPDFGITSGADTAFLPGTYLGNIELTVAANNPVSYQGFSFPFRQGLYLGAGGVDETKSVLAAVVGKKPSGFFLENFKIRSEGECFDGVYAAAGSYTLSNIKLDLTGNARSDFCGYGAAVVGTGTGTSLRINDARIETQGVARAAVVADKAANVVVKDSYIHTSNGVLPADYLPTINLGQMRSVPWMLGLSGNVRATNLLGVNTQASYINSYIGSEGWGVLSTDGCTTPLLTAINSTIEITGQDGYGSYGIGSATEYFLGCTFDVGTYSTISRGSFLYYDDSDAASVAALNAGLPGRLGLGLTEDELAGIPDKPTIVNSRRFGVMWHGGGTLYVGDAVFNTQEATFLDKNQNIAITVDGAEGAQLNPANGIIMQVMDDDDPGPGGMPYNVFTDPTTTPAQTRTLAQRTDPNGAVATFSDITLAGNFYNSVGWTGNKSGANPGTRGWKNLVLYFNDSDITGVISAAEAHHRIAAITINEYSEIGEITITPHEVVNSGVITFLNSGSNWTVTGTSYLSKLYVDPLAAVVGIGGQPVYVSVDGGAPQPIVPGTTYEGNVVVTIG